MPNWAVVIGIDRYADSGLSLKGAVRDAIQMATYLTEGESPLVEAARVKLLLSRTDASPEPPASLSAVEATLDNIFAAFQDIATKPAGRMFVHFSGHGFLADGLAGGESLAPTDFKKTSPLSIRLDSLRDFLRTTRFDEQLFFIDACRNVPALNFKVNPIAIDTEVQAMRPQVRQFVFCATLRGITAAEDQRVPNDERGVFTAPLVRGLRGEGSAKVFSEDPKEYLVTVGRLLRFVSSEVRKVVADLSGSPAPVTPALQEPRLVGEINDTEAVIVKLTPDRVPAVNLTVEVNPPEAARVATIFIRADDEATAGPPIVPNMKVTLPPKDYRVVVRADGFTPAKPSWPVALYDDMRLSLDMRPAQATRGLGRSRAAGPLPASLEFRSTNPLTLVRLVDRRGRVIASGKEAVVVEDIEPGVYRGQLIGPDGTLSEQTVVVDEGSSESVMVEAPPGATPLIGDASRRVGFAWSLPEARSGAGIDIEAVEEPTCRLIDAEIRSADGQDIAADAAASSSLAPGHYLVSTIVLSQRLTIALPALDGWQTSLLVDHREGHRGASSVVFVRLDGTHSDGLERIEIAQRYYQSGLFEATIDFLGEELTNPMALLLVGYSRLRQQLMLSKDAKAANSRDLARLRDIAGRLSAEYPYLCDAHVLTLETAFLSVAGRSRKQFDLCLQALQAGVPLFAFGAQRLLDHVRTFMRDPRYGRFLEGNARSELLEAAVATRVPTWPWTAWIHEPRKIDRREG